MVSYGVCLSLTHLTQHNALTVHVTQHYFKNSKILRDEFNQGITDLYDDNCRKGIAEDTNTWKDTSRSWVSRINVVKVSALSKAIYRFNESPVKSLMAFFTEIETNSETVRQGTAKHLEQEAVGYLFFPSEVSRYGFVQ